MPAMARVPPTVTLRLLVSTGGVSWSKASFRTRSRQTTPASTSTVGADRSMARIRRIEPIESRIPPSEIASRLWLCPAPRVETVRPCSRAKMTVAMTSRALLGETTRRGVPWNRFPKLVRSAGGSSSGVLTAPSMRFWSS